MADNNDNWRLRSEKGILQSWNRGEDEILVQLEAGQTANGKADEGFLKVEWFQKDLGHNKSIPAATGAKVKGAVKGVPLLSALLQEGNALYWADGPDAEPQLVNGRTHIPLTATITIRPKPTRKRAAAGPPPAAPTTKRAKLNPNAFPTLPNNLRSRLRYNQRTEALEKKVKAAQDALKVHQNYVRCFCIAADCDSPAIEKFGCPKSCDGYFCKAHWNDGHSMQDHVSKCNPN